MFLGDWVDTFSFPMNHNGHRLRRGGHMLEESLYYFNKAADVLGLSEKVRKILVTPR